MPIDSDSLLRRSETSAQWRARVFTLLQRSLLVWACLYLALVVVSGQTYLRSVAFGFALILALWLTLAAVFSDAETIPLPDKILLASIAGWCGWSVASLTWTINLPYTARELRSEVGWGLATAVIFYVAARTAIAFRVLLTIAIGVGAYLAVVAIWIFIRADTFDPTIMLRRPHGGIGAYSTYLCLVVPLLPLLLAPSPIGFGARPPMLVVAATLFALLLVAARLTENRMMWAALTVGFVLAGVLAAWRWRERLTRALWKWFATLSALLLLLSLLFIDVAGHRARTYYSPSTSVTQTLNDDPRILLWQHTFERIRARPWTGFGFGKSILREEFRAELNDPLRLHAHSMFLSQWLQTGAVGVAALLAVLVALALRYFRFMQAPDGTLAAIGLAGLALLACFMVKNLTDDFFIRPTSKEFWALNAMLIGYGFRRQPRLVQSEMR